MTILYAILYLIATSLVLNILAVPLKYYIEHYPSLMGLSQALLYGFIYAIFYKFYKNKDRELFFYVCLALVFIFSILPVFIAFYTLSYDESLKVDSSDLINASVSAIILGLSILLAQKFLVNETIRPNTKRFVKVLISTFVISVIVWIPYSQNIRKELKVNINSFLTNDLEKLKTYQIIRDKFPSLYSSMITELHNINDEREFFKTAQTLVNRYYHQALSIAIDDAEKNDLSSFLTTELAAFKRFSREAPKLCSCYLIGCESGKLNKSELKIADEELSNVKSAEFRILNNHKSALNPRQNGVSKDELRVFILNTLKKEYSESQISNFFSTLNRNIDDKTNDQLICKIQISIMENLLKIPDDKNTTEYQRTFLNSSPHLP